MTKSNKIFYHDDYHSWLKAEIDSRIAKNAQFSVNAFAAKINMSQSLLSLVLNRKRKLTRQRGAPLAEYLGLGNEERKYLDLLIQFDQSKSIRERNSIRRDIDELAKHLITAEEHSGKARPFSAWQYNALLAATDLTTIARTLDGLSQYLEFSPDAVEEGLRLLINIGLVSCQNGTYSYCKEGEGLLAKSTIRQSNWKISQTILEKALFKFQDNLLEVDTIFGRVVATNPQQIQIANKRIEAFAQELEEILRQGEHSVLAQFSIQLFDV